MGNALTPLDEVFSPIDLPCGRRLQNRLVKVAMYEHMARFRGGPPNEHHYALYSKWAQSSWGMIITGNVQVSSTHLSLGRDIIIPENVSKETLLPFRNLVSSIRGCPISDVLAVMQLSHAGRQSANIIGGRLPFASPLAPSSIKVKAKGSGWFSDMLHALAFQTPVSMSSQHLDDIVEAFVKGARVASESGFDGIQLHAAHGYLLAQFMSPMSNKRTDDYSTHPDNALRLLRRITSAIRVIVPKSFVIGIKINAADYLDSNESHTPSRATNHIRTIAEWGEIDFIEVSGGDYESPEFMRTKANSPRQALFSDLSKTVMDTLKSLQSPAPLPLVLLTGGLQTPEILHLVLESKHSHLLGIGRSSVLCPNLPLVLKHQQVMWTDSKSNPTWSAPFRPQPDLTVWPNILGFLPRIALLGAGVNMAWHIVVMRRFALSPVSAVHATNFKPNYSLGPVGAILWMWLWGTSFPRSVFYLLCLAALAGFVFVGFASKADPLLAIWHAPA